MLRPLNMQLNTSQALVLLSINIYLRFFTETKTNVEKLIKQYNTLFSTFQCKTNKRSTHPHKIPNCSASLLFLHSMPIIILHLWHVSLLVAWKQACVFRHLHLNANEYTQNATQTLWQSFKLLKFREIYWINSVVCVLADRHIFFRFKILLVYSAQQKNRLIGHILLSVVFLGCAHAAICSNKYTPQTEDVWNRPNSRCYMTKQSINKISSYPTHWIDGTAVVLLHINCTMWLPNSIQITEYTLVAGSNPTNQRQDKNKQPLWDVPLPWRQWYVAGLSSLISLFFWGDVSKSDV